jgi:hypothetical protein
MMRVLVADGDSLQVWRVAANILNMEWQTADNGWSSSMKDELGLTTPLHFMKYYTGLQTSDKFTGITYAMEYNDRRTILQKIVHEIRWEGVVG